MNNQKQIDGKFCEECGEIIKVKAEICPKCGVRSNLNTNKNKISAALLALILGFIGIHKFYLNQKTKGIIYILFSFTCIPAIISFFEAIILLFMSDAEFNKKYN